MIFQIYSSGFLSILDYEFFKIDFGNCFVLNLESNRLVPRPKFASLKIILCYFFNKLSVKSKSSESASSCL